MAFAILCMNDVISRKKRKKFHEDSCTCKDISDAAAACSYTHWFMTRDEYIYFDLAYDHAGVLKKLVTCTCVYIAKSVMLQAAYKYYSYSYIL